MAISSLAEKIKDVEHAIAELSKEATRPAEDGLTFEQVVTALKKGKTVRLRGYEPFSILDVAQGLVDIGVDAFFATDWEIL